MAELSDAKRRIIERLKRVDSATAPQLAELFVTTDTAVRQHLEALEQAGLVESFVASPAGRGRPPLHWRLTALAADLFPDRHGELSVGLIEAIREALGEDGLERVIAARATRQLAGYRSALPDPQDGDVVHVRLRRLAELRTAEGYLAEVVADDGGHVLIEHHCPVSDAATACQGLCRSELALFRDALGPGVRVERVQHLLSGDARCAYRITPT